LIFSILEFMGAFRWGNMPIPEGHVVLLVACITVNLWRPLYFFDSVFLRHLPGWPLLLAGILLAAWAIAAAGEVELESPHRLIDQGPYQYSRNPMYLAWTAIYLGAAFLFNNGWLLICLPALLVYTHSFVIRREERLLDQQFGEAYRRYRDRVPRYF
jgi:protein-S-isoprenylcysteine O-methyltransferase Ste14